MWQNLYPFETECITKISFESVFRADRINHVQMSLDFTFALILSICLFCESISLPISTAMFLRLVIIPVTSVMLFSISSSRASFVILKVDNLLFFIGSHQSQILKSMCHTKRRMGAINLLACQRHRSA